MKAKNLIRLLAVLLWLAGSGTGWCFYNPSTGRWLSRDPLGDRGGRNLYNFLDNESVNGVDLLGLVILCDCAVEEYFKQNGIGPQMYDKSGNTYSVKTGFSGQGPSSGVGEILWDMLRSSYAFKAKGGQVSELKQHVSARLNVIAETSKATWIFGNTLGFNPLYWVSHEVAKANAAGALADMFDPVNGPKYYTRACHWSGDIVMMKGVMDTIGARPFNTAVGSGNGATLRSLVISAGLMRLRRTGYVQQPSMPARDWVPGDASFLNAHGDPSLLQAGEWLIYVGQRRYWGFLPPPFERTVDIDVWWERARSWSTDKTKEPELHGERWFPGVGLEPEAPTPYWCLADTAII